MPTFVRVISGQVGIKIARVYHKHFVVVARTDDMHLSLFI